MQESGNEQASADKRIEIEQALDAGKTLSRNREFDEAARTLTLAYFAAANSLFVDLMSELNKALLLNARQCVNRGGRAPGDKYYDRDDQLCFVVSYPRSGNTYTLNALNGVLPSRIYGGMVTPYNCFFARDSYWVPPSEFALIKDHRYKEAYSQDRTVYIVRDGRDSILSFAHMQFKGNKHNFFRRGELADYIRFNQETCAFGDWASNVREALSAKAGGAEVKIQTYEELQRYPNSILAVAEFISPGTPFTDADLERAIATAEQRQQALKKVATWGYGETAPPESYFHEWSLNRGESNWTQAFDLAAKKAFHESGATEILMELGFEDDPDWWKEH